MHEPFRILSYTPTSPYVESHLVITPEAGEGVHSSGTLATGKLDSKRDGRSLRATKNVLEKQDQGQRQVAGTASASTDGGEGQEMEKKKQFGRQIGPPRNDEVSGAQMFRNYQKFLAVWNASLPQHIQESDGGERQRLVLECKERDSEGLGNACNQSFTRGLSR